MAECTIDMNLISKYDLRDHLEDKLKSYSEYTDTQWIAGFKEAIRIVTDTKPVKLGIIRTDIYE